MLLRKSIAHGLSVAGRPRDRRDVDARTKFALDRRKTPPAVAQQSEGKNTPGVSTMGAGDTLLET
jgi:hypothetical protein